MRLMMASGAARLAAESPGSTPHRVAAPFIPCGAAPCKEVWFLTDDNSALPPGRQLPAEISGLPEWRGGVTLSRAAELLDPDTWSEFTGADALLKHETDPKTGQLVGLEMKFPDKDALKARLWESILASVNAGRLELWALHPPGDPRARWEPFSHEVSDELTIENVNLHKSSVTFEGQQPIKVRLFRPDKDRWQAPGSMGAETACKKWLHQESQLGKPIRRKSDCMGKALKLFPGLSKRGFGRAWDAVVPQSWKKPGRRPNTQRKSKHRTN